MRSHLLAIVTTLAFLVGATIAWREWDGDHAPVADSGVVPQTNSPNLGRELSQPTDGKSVARAGSQKRTDPFADSSALPGDDIARLSASELSAVKLPANVQQQTSWQNPFRPELWNLANARLDQGALAFDGIGRAMFLRSYSRLMTEFHVRDMQNAGEHVPLNFDVELFTPAQDAGLVVRFADGECRLEVRTANAQTQVLRSQEVESLTGGGHVRINATANRIMVAWNGRIVINAARPSALVNSQLYVQLINRTPPRSAADADSIGLVVSELRFEGE